MRLVKLKDDQTINLKEKDVILIDKDELYYFNGNCKIVIPCTPAWYQEQYKLVN